MGRRMMQVYRLETPGRVGVYECGAASIACQRLGSKHYAFDASVHPAPWLEFFQGQHEVITRSDRRYAFTSMKQLREWFFEPEFLRIVGDLGVELSIYEVDPAHVVAGSTQCVFNVRMARQISFAPLKFDPDPGRYNLCHAEHQALPDGR